MNGASGREVIRCFVKGAPDQLLARAAHGRRRRRRRRPPADGEFRQRYLAENQRLGEQGLRVIATARKDFDPAAFDPAADLLPLVTGLELLALVGIVDPPRPTARASIATAKKAGIRVRMITGDYAVTAAAVAGQLRHRRGGAHRRRVRRDERRGGTDQDRRHRRDRQGQPRAQGPPGRRAQEARPDRRDDRGRRQRRAGGEEGRHRDRDGHRHRGDPGSRGDDPDRRQLLHHRQGRRTGPRAV